MKPLAPSAALRLAPVTRREAVGGLAALLAAGLWPGALRAAADKPKPVPYEEFTFVALNDFHHREPACDPWFTALFHQVTQHKDAEFYLLLGDLADNGAKDSFTTIRRLVTATKIPFHAVPGNHDCPASNSYAAYAEVFPDSFNHVFTHRGWQFVALDSSEGTKYNNTHIQPATFQWLDAELPKLDPLKPTVICTHFPLSAKTPNCPLNAEDVLQRFLNFNLRLTLGGHFHGKTLEKREQFELVTNACCSRVANNHDGTKDKGYWLCHAKADGTVERAFQLFTFTAPAAPTVPAIPVVPSPTTAPKPA